MRQMNKIKTVCVYCGSGPGTNPRFTEAAGALGKTFAENNIRLVYGGGSVGLMAPSLNLRSTMAAPSPESFRTFCVPAKMR